MLSNLASLPEVVIHHMLLDLTKSGSIFADVSRATKEVDKFEPRGR